MQRVARSAGSFGTLLRHMHGHAFGFGSKHYHLPTDSQR